MAQPMSVYATSISELKQQKAENEKKLGEVNKNITELANESKGITEELAVLDDQLVEILASVSMLEEDIEEVKEQIEITKVELEEAIKTEEEQYQAMKKRIQYMYEKGDSSYVALLLGASSIGDVMSRAEYIEQMYEYDQNLLNEYIAAKEKVEETKIKLEEEQSELEASLYELELEKAILDELIAEKEEQQKDFETQLAKAKQEAAAYKAKIKQQNSQIKKLEEEARKAAEAAAKKNSGGLNSASIISSAKGSASGKEIANYACKFVGNPYVLGGTSLTNGADCSGFTYSVYKAFGYSIPRTSTAQRSAGRGVTYADAQPGDIICYAGHVAIYLGGGRIVHASTPATGIKYGTATYKEILAVRRIVN
jgi:cell wall-associated NlpC family hydrolase/uncharacterized protein YoxC